MRAQPLRDEFGRVLRQSVEKGMLRLRISYLLHQNSKLFIVTVNLAEAGSVGGIKHVGSESSSQRIVNLDSDVVDRRLWVFMEVLVYADGVWKLDRW